MKCLRQKFISGAGRPFSENADRSSPPVPRAGSRVAALLLSAAVCGSAQAQNTTRVSVDDAGVQATMLSIHPVNSADGRYVAFLTPSQLVAADVNGNWDCYRYDRQTGAVVLVSVSTSGTGNGGNNTLLATSPAISADGRYVAFSSLASDMIGSDGNGVGDVFLRDITGGTTVRVSEHTDGTEATMHSYSPVISADGRKVVFISQAGELVDGDLNGVLDVFLHDVDAGTTERISVAGNGDEGNGASDSPALSADGNLVVFRSIAANFVTPDANAYDIFLRDRAAGTTVRISEDSSGVQANGNGAMPSISADGRFVSFTSYADNLHAGDTDTIWDVFVKNTQTGDVKLASVNASAVKGDASTDFNYRTRLSDDGRYVMFLSQATNLVSGDTNALVDLFVSDLYSGATTPVARLSTDSAGNQVTDFPAKSADLSADGQFAVFFSDSTELITPDGNVASDIFNVENLLYVADTDGDGLRDDQEVALGTDPGLTDSDGDGLTDLEEASLDGDPFVDSAADTDGGDPDSDNDGYDDGTEVDAGTDPNDPASFPAAVADGDVNLDGMVDLADLIVAEKIIKGTLNPPATQAQLDHFDVAPLVGGIPSPDTNYNMGDLSVLRLRLLGKVSF